LKSGQNYIAVVPSSDIAAEIRSKLICDDNDESEDEEQNADSILEEEESNEH